MKIATNKKAQPVNLNLAERISQPVGTKLFWGLIIAIGLFLGFLYAWRLSPNAGINVAAHPTDLPATATPTLEPTPAEAVPALPVLTLSLDLESLQTGRLGLQAPVSAWLTYNQMEAIPVQAGAIIGVEEDIQSWNLTLPEDDSVLPWQTAAITLQPTDSGDVVILWTYLQQLAAAGIKVPDLSLALLTINDQAPQAAYLLQSSDPMQDTGFAFQMSQDFFTAAAKDEPTRQQILEEVQRSIAANRQGDIAPDVLQRGLSLLNFLMQVPDEIPAHIDLEDFADYFTIHDLWGVSYTDAWQDTRYFYNDATGMIEPFIEDISQITFSGNRGERTFPFSGLNLFQWPDMQIAYIQTLHGLTYRPDYQAMRAATYAAFHQQEKQIQQATGMPYSTIWDVLDFRNGMLQLQTEPAYPLRVYVYGEEASPCIHVDLLNLMHFPVDVTAVSFMGESMPIQTAWLSMPSTPALLQELPAGFRLTPYANPDQYLSLCIPTASLEAIRQQSETKKTLQELLQSETDWSVSASVSGLQRMYSVAMLPQIPPQTDLQRPMPAVQTIEAITDIYPFITANRAGDTLTIHAGSWQIDNDLVMPAGLNIVIEPGTTLQFGPQALWLSYSAIQAKGTAQAPIVITSSAAGWPGLVVLNAQESVLEHTTIENTTGIARQGWILTGGITFYYSPVKLISSVIQNNQTEDAINIIHAAFTFDQLTIQNAPSDAFDSDFSDGDILNCRFTDIGGDAIDTSGANVYVTGSSMQRITDKGLSAGEESHIIAEQVNMDTVGIGGAAKDLSKLEIRNSVITNARVAGLAAYIKKAVFGPSNVLAENVQILETTTTSLVQTGSSISLDGKDQPTQELDVKTLYTLGILGN